MSLFGVYLAAHVQWMEEIDYSSRMYRDGGNLHPVQEARIILEEALHPLFSVQPKGSLDKVTASLLSQGGVRTFAEFFPHEYEDLRETIRLFRRAYLRQVWPLRNTFRERSREYPFSPLAVDVLQQKGLQIRATEGIAGGNADSFTNLATYTIYLSEGRTPVTILHEVQHLFYGLTESQLPGGIFPYAGASPLESALTLAATRILRDDPDLVDYILEAGSTKAGVQL